MWFPVYACFQPFPYFRCPLIIFHLLIHRPESPLPLPSPAIPVSSIHGVKKEEKFKVDVGKRLRDAGDGIQGGSSRKVPGSPWTEPDEENSAASSSSSSSVETICLSVRSTFFQFFNRIPAFWEGETSRVHGSAMGCHRKTIHRRHHLARVARLFLSM